MSVVADQIKRTMSTLSEAMVLVVDEREQLQDENERLKDLLCVADEALMLSHGCFPLDRTTDRERYLNDAAKAIRSVTGDDFDRRKASAARVLFEP